MKKQTQIEIDDVVFEFEPHPLIAQEQKPEIATHGGYKAENSNQCFMYLSRSKYDVWKAHVSVARGFDSFQVYKSFPDNFSHSEVVRWGLDVLKDNNPKAYDNLVKPPYSLNCTKGDLESIKLALEYACEAKLLIGQDYKKLTDRINRLEKE